MIEASQRRYIMHSKEKVSKNEAKLLRTFTFGDLKPKTIVSNRYMKVTKIRQLDKITLTKKNTPTDS